MAEGRNTDRQKMNENERIRNVAYFSIQGVQIGGRRRSKKLQEYMDNIYILKVKESKQ